MSGRRLHEFPGGLKLEGHKSLSNAHPIRRAPLSELLVIPLQQHIGEPAEPLVKVGQKVLKGEPIAKPQGYISVPVHASSSGTVIAIDDHPVPHPSGLSAPCILIKTDGDDKWCEPPRFILDDWREMEPSALRNRIREAGIVGLGGAGFPTFIKLNPGTAPAVDWLILNGAECEPYITCDDLVMRERAEQIVGGLLVMRHALHAARCLIGIEDNKPEAIARLGEVVAALGDDTIEVVPVPTRYPAGGEKQLIKVLTGREVPSNGLPLDVRVVCHNVATAAAVFQAVEDGRPLVSRVVTVTGHGIQDPCNLEVPIGTPVEDLLREAGHFTDSFERLIIGGPMMGFEITSLRVPVIKTTNCLLAVARDELPGAGPQLPCIRCGACAETCPARLQPQMLYWYSQARDFDRVQDFKLFDCIECGCCSYVCPSHIPLVHYYRYAKTEIWAREREREKADHARRRHEFRQERLEREKRERQERLRKKQAAAKAGSDKKAEIQAALARVKQKKAKQAADGEATDK